MGGAVGFGIGQNGVGAVVVAATWLGFSSEPNHHVWQPLSIMAIVVMMAAIAVGRLMLRWLLKVASLWLQGTVLTFLQYNIFVFLSS